jgi:hypothetical protein
MSLLHVCSVWGHNKTMNSWATIEAQLMLGKQAND